MIDLAFLGLSTITSERPPPPETRCSGGSVFRFGALAVREAELVAARFRAGFSVRGRFRWLLSLRTFLPRCLPTYPLPLVTLRSIPLDLQGRGARG